MKSLVIRGLFAPLALLAVASSCSSNVDSSNAGEQVSSAHEAIATTPQDLCEFTAYSSQKTTFQDRATSATGFVGSATGVTLGNDSHVAGHVRSSGTAVLLDRVHVDGNITTGGTFTPGHQDVIGGTVTQHTPVAAFTIPSKTVTPGTTDVIVNGGQSRSVNAGSYRDLHLFAGSTVTFHAGTYNARTLVIESSSVHVIMDISGGPIDLNIQGQLRFGDGMHMDLVGGTNPRQVRYYTNFTTQVSIGNDLTLFGVVTAPNADIVGFSRTKILGSVFGRTVSLGPDNSVSGACECGNGFVDPNEQCDDGNTNNNDGCTNACKLAVCGDGIVETGVEQCDDGNTNNNDGCTNACKIAVCGDGIVETGVEECDDGNSDNTDACTNACKNAVCGDGFVHVSTEQCDDGNTNNNDDCTNNCTVAVCGDGIVHTGVEECDDGNTNDLDSCTTPGAFGEPGCEFRPLRKNFAKISQAERTALINAIVTLDSGAPSLLYPDGVTFWDKQDQIHQATHVHGGPSFMPWHRELINRFEKLLRQVDPTVALHYWDWTTDPLASPDGQGGTVNFFTSITMGSPSGRAGVPFDTFDNNGNPVGARIEFDTDPAQFLLPPREIDRNVTCGTAPASESDATVIASADGLPQAQQWESFRLTVENIHNERHGCIGGTLGDPHASFQDPFVFLLHSNNDRVFAMWQVSPGHDYRLDPAQVYGMDTGDTGTHGTAQELQPWNGVPDGCISASCPPVSPWIIPSPEVVHKTSESASVVRPPRYDTM
jgi:cysteine-rich repeat protein